MAIRKFILYADDDKDDVELMNGVFKDHPEYTLVAFDSGLPLLDYLQSVALHQVSLILLDINMPNLGGVATLRIMRSDDKIKHLPVVMFSTSTSEADRKNSNLLGAEVLMKPTTGSELHEIRNCILKHCFHNTGSHIPDTVATLSNN
jgi:CheY-like chemotaxis protein